MKLLTNELRDRLLANGREQAKVKGTKAEHDFWPVVKFFYPAGAATWLATELDPEDPDIAFGLCGDRHNDNDNDLRVFVSRSRSKNSVGLNAGR
jgi:Protein of unknown function (DUF2958)